MVLLLVTRDSRNHRNRQSVESPHAEGVKYGASSAGVNHGAGKFGNESDLPLMLTIDAMLADGEPEGKFLYTPRTVHSKKPRGVFRHVIKRAK